MSDREMLELAAKAGGVPGRFIERMPEDGYPTYSCGIGSATGNLWNPLADDGDAFRLTVKLHINIIFSGGRHHVGLDRHIFDICRYGGMEEFRWEIVNVAACIGRIGCNPSPINA